MSVFNLFLLIIVSRANELLCLKFSMKLTENASTFKAPCCCFENVPNTALTIVCTLYVSIDCNGFDVSNLPQKKNILK